jgi:hypothetical protein
VVLIRRYGGRVAYHSFRLDWDTSQVRFQHGFKEINPRFTVSGYPRDMPISYQAGNRQIQGDALRVAGTSLLNNLIENVFERSLLQSSPDHRRLIRTLGWIERITFASYLTYRQSSPLSAGGTVDRWPRSLVPVRSVNWGLRHLGHSHASTS